MRAAALSVLVTATLAACRRDPVDPAPPAACPDVELIVAASDYTMNVVCGAPGCAIGPRTSGPDLGTDPQLSSSDERIFFLARDRDLVFELDPSCGRPISRFSVDEARSGRAPANPHDASAAPDGSVWIVLYDTPKIAIAQDGVLSDTLDLSAYDDDGNPQADSIRIVDVGGAPKAFVALERLDDQGGLRSTRPSQMLRIDVTTRAVEAVIELAGRNPFNPMSEHRGALFLAEPGNFDSATEPLAGIERFDTATSTTRLLVLESELGGSVSEVAVTEGCGAAIVAGPERDVNPTSLVTFDPETGQVYTTARAPVLGPTPGYDLQGLAWRGGHLFVGDRRRGGEGYPVHVLERAGGGCDLRDAARTIHLPQRPVALRPAR
jgi:hypothetical protein